MRVPLFISCALLVSNCAIRPLPEQSTGVTTYNIVRQIRCETRDAIFNTYIDALTKNPAVFDERAQIVAERFKGHPEWMDELKPSLFAGNARQFVDYFWNTGIAYNFTLDMTEVNNLDSEINFLKALERSKRMLGIKAGMDRQRENTRTFTITDDFKGLLNLKPKNYCDGHLAGENIIYPMTGKIGIELFVHEFVRVALFTNLGNKEQDGAPTMVDTLQFQTTISGSAAPKIVFTPVGEAFHVADVSLTAALTRKDIHTLVMGLSVVAAPPTEAVPRGRAMFGRLLTSKGGGTRQAAANAVDQELTRQALSRTIVVPQ